MKPILFEKDTTSFNNNGLGVISDAVRCEVTETINGAFELVLDYPICGDMFASFAVNRIIYAPPNAYTAWQPFRIYEIDKSIDGYITISAEHKAYDLNGQICLPNNEHSETPDSVTGLMSYLTSQSAASSQALGVSQFTFSTDINASDNWVIDRPMSIREAMTYAQNLFGGEWEYNNTQCVLRARRGQNRGVRVRYGDNLLSYRRSETDNSYTHIMPYWTDGTNYVYTEPEYILVSATSSQMQKKVIPLDLSGQFETAPEPADLLQAAYRSDEYRHPPALEISETVSFISLSQTLEYQYLVDSDHVELGDDVGVKVPILDVEATARCNRIVFDVLRERNKTSTLGTLAQTLAASLKKTTAAANLHIGVYVDISEPTENIKQGDYWIKVDNMTDLNAISVGRYENGEWLLLCKFNGGGGDVTLPNVFVQASAPPVAINAGDFLVTYRNSVVSDVKRYQNGVWAAVEYMYGTNPGELTSEGVYYVYISGGEIQVIMTKVGSNIVGVAVPYRTAGLNFVYINTIDTASEGDYWLEINENQKDLYSVRRLSDQSEWETLYNSAVPALFILPGEPASANVKDGAYWIQIDNFTDMNIQYIKKRVSGSWATVCVPAGGSGEVTINISHAILVDKGSVV
jgi:phage minor structural protein